MAYNSKANTKNIPKNIKNKDVPKYYKWTYVADNGKIVGSNISQETAYSYLLNQNNKFSQEQSAKSLADDRQTAADNNAWSAGQAQLNRDWQEQMSNTAHQREVKDLISAGLNPVLSANAGAVTGSGAVGTTDTGATGLKSQLAMKKLDLQNARQMAELNAGVQLQMNQQNIASAQKMAKWQNALQRELGYAGFANNEKLANISAGASAYAAQQAASAAYYGANQSYAASKYATDNPQVNNPWAAINSLLGGKSNSAKSSSGFFASVKKAWNKVINDQSRKKGQRPSKRK
uniref:DNA pilot protein n=1 Tax=Dulem virus 166 TaxID=3145643 RepID=A0AAU8AV30_9VIRU